MVPLAIVQYLHFMNFTHPLGAWIITGGTSTGVMEFVGDAVQDYTLQTGSSDQEVVALGIATWGIVDNKRNLISEEVRITQHLYNRVPLYT